MKLASRSTPVMYRARLAAVTVALCLASSVAHAQFLVPPANNPPVNNPPAQQPVFPNVTDMNSRLAATSALTDLGTNFLRRLGNHATWGFNTAANSNPSGAGASQSTAPATFPVRAWVEVYGLTSRTGAQGTFVGDKRETVGGVAGFGATIAPNLSVGIWVDQSHTGIDVPLAAQSAKLDLTQVGVNASYTVGEWTLAAAGVHGFGNITGRRATALGFANSGYNGYVDAALAELSYYWSIGQGRVVPKASFEYLRAVTDAFAEFGGSNPVSAGQATAERTRVLIGAEVGHYWIVDRRVIDISAYGKFVDNLHQNISSVQVSLGTNTIAVQGVRESRYGADAGASLSVGLTNAIRMYLSYDGKFRNGFESHQGLLGFEVKW
ncbi:MAG: autotransporter protein [Proteobacteria bacterium SG_bin9]|nr:MAG: autotransporter protein [Proteobacteria bacterium SG_bin9]